MAGSRLPLHSLFPALPVTTWGVLSGVLGLALVWSGRYALFEKGLGVFVLLMFVTMVGAAVLTLPNLGQILTGLVPPLPDGSIVRTVNVAGGSAAPSPWPPTATGCARRVGPPPGSSR